MSFAEINLLTPQRKVQVYERKLGRRWVLAGMTYCALLVFAWGTVTTGVVKESGVRTELADVEQKLVAKRSEFSASQSQLTASRRQYDAARAVGHHPDWSVLLTLVAIERFDEAQTEGGSEIVLETCQMKRASTIQTRAIKPAKGASTAEVLGRAQFEMTGVALKSRDVQKYVLRLEKTGLFESVSVKGNTRDSTRAGGPSLHAFTIVCEMVEPGQAVNP